jgi:signal transduction histidine kinase
VFRHPRLASLATAEWPAWLWSADGSQMLWANAVGAAIFGAATSRACANRRFSVNEVPAAQVLRLAATLPSGGQERLERLRGFGGNLGRALTCTCSRIAAGDGSGAVLIVAAEPAGPALTLAERVQRLLDDDADPAAAFVPDGRLVYANAQAQHWLDGTSTLAALGLEVLAAAALHTGTANTAAKLNGDACDILLACLGQGASSVVLVILQQPARQANLEANLALATQLEFETAPGSQNRSAEPMSSAPASGIGTPAAAPARAAAETSLQRRHPLRFVWDMDADGRFTIASDEFLQLIGGGAALLGRPWRDIAAELELDPADLVAAAVESHETWSGIAVSWPILAPPGSDWHSELRLPIELSGLPVFDRDRSFRGYRGFGVCRDLAQINGLGQAPRGKSAPAPALSPAVPLDRATTAAPDPALADAGPSSAKVVPFRPAAVEPKPAPSLTPIERRAFRELAQELTSRLRGPHAAATAEAVAQELAASQDQALSQDELRQVLSQALNQENNAEFGEEASQDDNQESEHSADETEQPDTQANEASRSESQEQSEEQSQEQSQEQSEEQNQEPRQAASEPAHDAASEQELDGVRPVAEQSFAPAFLDRIPLGILVYRHDELLYANRHFLDLSGYSDVAAIEAAGGLNRLFAEPGAGTVFAESGAAAAAIITESGERLPVEGRMVAVPWNAAPAMALILNKSQSQGASTGASAVPAATATDELAEREAQRTAAAKAEFVARISHDIRNPLTAISGFAEAIMSERFGPIGNERYREYIKDLHAAAAHMASMVDDLFDLSKLESGRIDLTFANVNLNELVQQCVGMMQPQANRARIIIRSALTSGLPRVKADERALQQIMLNLLSNAIKFTGPGGQIIVSTVFSDAREAILRVRDTGAGMSEKQIAAALEPFADIDAWAKSGTGETEFGLPLTKALAKANHAQFRIKSAPEAGTLVEIAFPGNRTVVD